MKLYILNTGILGTDKNNVEAHATMGTLSNKAIKNEWCKLPVMAFLIEIEGDFILYDLGSNPEAMNGYWPKHLQEIYPLTQLPEQSLEAQLALCGVQPKDIKTVILSHLHLDHAGNLSMFEHADVYVAKDEFMYAQTQVRLSQDPLTHGGYIKADLDVAVKQYHLVEEDFIIAPGVEVVRLPGHTPDLLGLVIHGKEKTYILPQDAVYTKAIFGPPAKASGLLYDSLSYFKSIEKVRKLAKLYDADVIYAHDWDFFQTLKTAPEWYE